MDDYISREEAKRFFNLNFGGVSHAIIASRLLDEIPAADVSPVRHGRWVKIGTTGLCGDPVWNCSSCGYPAGVSVAGRDYCPNCGAKMDGGINHEI